MTRFAIIVGVVILVRSVAAGQFHEPILFEANHGQASKGVLFTARSKGYIIDLLEDSAVLKTHTATIRLDYIAKKKAEVQVPKQRSYVNYFIGNFAASDIPTYDSITYKGIYDGIDLVYHTRQGVLEYDFRIAAGVDPSVIALKFNGVCSIRIDQTGALVINTGDGDIIQPAPYAYQEAAGQKKPVDCSYTIKDDIVGFKLGAYDASLPLVIDPELRYATYLGGERSDIATGVAVDTAGNVYVVGYTNSLRFPTRNQLQQADSGAGDAFLSRFDAEGRLAYSTYIGGGLLDQALGVAIASDGSIYIVGLTQSLDFPTRNALQNNYSGRTDAFLTKISADGRSISFSTYLGGTGEEEATAVAIDTKGDVYVAGSTNSIEFPVSSNAFQKEPRGFRDIFVAKFTSSGSRSYATYIGGFANDLATAIKVDSLGRAYVVGNTLSDNYPTVKAFQSSRAGGGSPRTDGVISIVSAGGNSLDYSTFFGGEEEDLIRDIALDTQGNFYIVGTTRSVDLRVVNAFQPTNKGGSFGAGLFLGPYDAFLSKFSPDGSRLLISTYLGGSEYDDITGISLDPAGNIYLCGVTSSEDFPLSRAFQRGNASRGEQRADTFVAKFNPTIKILLYSTYYGGSRNDVALRIATERSGNAYVVGVSASTDFPVVRAFQSNFAGGEAGASSGDAFLIRIDNTAGYSLTSDVSSITLKRRQSGKVKISVIRDEDYLNPVTITAPDLSKQSITVSPATITVTGQETAVFDIKPKRKAPVRSLDLIFTGRDANGLEKTVFLKLRVTE
ncbi:MAG: SBBP repeat-containing protein [Acidobacteriota bacterium]|nr:SBBP repeat-containing protein [Blastocatellia bacterium]MDW8412188.1 SBBP repeat-containing protein [Acidobacteriota bacterium]